MDKWDELVNRVKQGILAEEPEAALAGGLQLLAEIGRTFEQIGADVDRIATVLEGKIPMDDIEENMPVAQVHDL
jgi:hypothetical protein